jgi:hypothetical protein
MLTLAIAEQEFYDARKEIFITSKAMTIQLEHSLISMSKWEAIWCKPFIPVKGKAEGITNHAEELSYIECMIIGRIPKHLPTVIYQQHGEEIRDYISNPRTATTIYRHDNSQGSGIVITTELIYYWMVRFGIPSEYEKWHINRLLTLIDICNLKEKEGAGKNKMTPKEAAKYQYQMNRARRGV